MCGDDKYKRNKIDLEIQNLTLQENCNAFKSIAVQYIIEAFRQTQVMLDQSTISKYLPNATVSTKLRVTKVEIVVFQTHHSHRVSLRKSALLTRKSRDTVSQVLKDEQVCKKKKTNTCIAVLKDSTIPLLKHLATKIRLSTRKIHHHVQLLVTVRRVQQILSETKHTVYYKAQTRSMITKQHKSRRHKFAKSSPELDGME